MIAPEVARRRCADFIRKQVRSARAKGAAVGVSGGVDSAVVVTLCAEALGPEDIRAAVLPSDSTPLADTEDAMGICRSLGVPTICWNIQEVLSSFKVSRFPLVPYGNLKARVRMAYLYYLANSEDKLVVGTGDRSEEQIGFFTKYGDGGVDISPIGDLYKTEVRILARHLGISPAVVDKPSSPRLWDGHSAEEELGAGYEEIDGVLTLFERGVEPKTELRRQLRLRMKRNAHKLSPPPVCRFR